ncbi:MAG: hydroxyacid dehydrogenase [candidate division WOR-3 bacterium]
MGNYKILITDKIHEEGKNYLISKGFEVKEILNLSEEELAKLIKDFHVLIVRSATKVTKNIIENASNLKIIGRAGVGLDNIDVKAAEERGIKVINSPEASSVAVAELAILFILSALRNFPHAHISMKEGKWEKSKFMGLELKGKKVGIIGYGRIGKEVAKRLKCFETEILVYDPYVKRKENKTFVQTLEEIFSNCDIITIHTPLTEETKYMINKKILEKAKRGIIIVNCARGGIINEKDLLWALNEGIVSYACLDVYENEPPKNFELLNHPNVILTPHIGAQTLEAQSKASLILAEKIYKELIEFSSKV